MLYVPAPPSSPLCLLPPLLRSLAPWAESRQNATCAGWQAFPETQTTAALLLLLLLPFLHLLLLLLLTAAELPGL